MDKKIITFLRKLFLLNWSYVYSKVSYQYHVFLQPEPLARHIRIMAPKVLMGYAVFFYFYYHLKYNHRVSPCLTLQLLGHFSCFFCEILLSADFFSNSSLKKYLRNTIRVPNSLDPDQAQQNRSSPTFCWV